MALTTSELFNFVQGSDITGESSYDIWKSINPEGTEQEFLEYLKGKSAYEIWVSKEENAGKTEEEFIESLSGGNESDLIFTELIDTVEGDEPTMSAIVDARFIALENRVVAIENELGNSVARLSVL